jgi:hypothetical protein
MSAGGLELVARIPLGEEEVSLLSEAFSDPAAT